MFVYWLHIIEFILNNAHHTERSPCFAATEQHLELRQGSYKGSLRGIEARASITIVKGLCDMDKASGTFDLHGFCLLVLHVFLATSCLSYADTVPLIVAVKIKLIAVSEGSLQPLFYQRSSSNVSRVLKNGPVSEWYVHLYVPSSTQQILVLVSSVFLSQSWLEYAGLCIIRKGYKRLCNKKKESC